MKDSAIDKTAIKGFNDANGTTMQFSKPNTKVGQTMGESKDYTKAPKGNGMVNGKSGDNTAKKQYSN